MTQRNWKIYLFTILIMSSLSSRSYALENEFHGLYNMTYFVSNYESAGAPGFILTGPNSTLNAGPAGLPTGNSDGSLKENNYFEQRARIYYSAKSGDTAKLVTAFEIDSVWGDKSGSSANRNSGAALEGDAVNLETKWVHLDLKIPSIPTRAKIGLQPFKDNIKGLFADFDAAGISTITDLGAAKIQAAYFRGYDQSYFSTSPTVRGVKDLDIGVVGIKYGLDQKTNIGFDYYLYIDPRDLNVPAANENMTIHTFGLYGDTTIAKTNLSGLLAYQSGEFEAASGEKSDLNAYAFNLAAKAPLGQGTFKTAFLYTSGNGYEASNGNGKDYTGWVGTNSSQNANWNVGTGGTNSYNDSDMMLLNRSTMNMPSTTDNHLIFNSGNGTTPTNSQGQYLYSLGYSHPVSDNLNIKSNLGLAWAAKANNLKPINKNTGKVNDSNFQGGEVNLETSYKVYDNVTAKFQAAYLMLGDYYKNSWSAAVTNAGVQTPEDPYSVRFIINYVF